AFRGGQLAQLLVLAQPDQDGVEPPAVESQPDRCPGLRGVTEPAGPESQGGPQPVQGPLAPTDPPRFPEVGRVLSRGGAWLRGGAGGAVAMLSGHVVGQARVGQEAPGEEPDRGDWKLLAGTEVGIFETGGGVGGLIFAVQESWQFLFQSLRALALS